MAKDVLCEVTNCHFWESGNQCGAEEIKVVTRKGKKQKTPQKQIVRPLFQKDDHLLTAKHSSLAVFYSCRQLQSTVISI